MKLAGRRTLRAGCAAALGSVAFLAAALTIGDPGVTWDEPAYLESAKLEMAWLAALPRHAAGGDLAAWVSRDTLEAYWNHAPYSNPHPPFYKVLGGLTWAAFHERIGEHSAFRLSSAVLFGLLVGALASWGARIPSGGGWVAGAGAALSLALMPRVFGHAHVAATDMPLTAFWTLSALFFWRSVREGRLRDELLFGAFWGMALATKFTGLLLPVPLAAWALLHARPHLLRVLLVGGCVAAGLALALQPHLWPDPPGRLLAFVQQSTSRAEWAPISTWYLGRVYAFRPPWHHSLVLTLVTVPLPILLLSGAGVLRLRQPTLRPLLTLCLVQLAFWQVLMALPSSPNHDGVRLFLPQFPFLALLAGVGFGSAWRRMEARAGGFARQAAAADVTAPAPWRVGVRRMGTLRAGLCALLFLPPAVATVRAHPFELAYYNEVVGGARGAHARGFETAYWYDAATTGFLRRLERELPHGARVWVHAHPGHFTYLQQAGLLRRDLVFTRELPAPYLLLQTRQGLFGPFEWRLHESVLPLAEVVYDGVPLLALYRWD